MNDLHLNRENLISIIEYDQLEQEISKIRQEMAIKYPTGKQLTDELQLLIKLDELKKDDAEKLRQCENEINDELAHYETELNRFKADIANSQEKIEISNLKNTQESIEQIVKRLDELKSMAQNLLEENLQKEKKYQEVQSNEKMLQQFDKDLKENINARKPLKDKQSALKLSEQFKNYYKNNLGRVKDKILVLEEGEHKCKCGISDDIQEIKKSIAQQGYHLCGNCGRIILMKVK